VNGIAEYGSYMAANDTTFINIAFTFTLLCFIICIFQSHAVT